MNLKLGLGAFLISIYSYSQNLAIGAIETDAAVYKAIGQAPLPQGSNIPISVDLSSRMPPVGDQNPQLSCVAWATAYAAFSYTNSQSINCNYLNGDGNLNTDCIFSPAFIYNQINGGVNKGTKYEDAFRVMVNQGNTPLSAMPYIPNNVQHQPSAQARQLAANYKIDSYWQLGANNEDIFLETKAFLAQGIPVIVSAKVDNYFRSTSNYPNPYVWTHWSGNVEQMGHAVLIVGYDDNTRRFKFINSWGTNWGNQGYGYISYNMYGNGAVSQAWIIKTKNSVVNTPVVLARESKNLNQADIQAGLNFIVNPPSFFVFPPGYTPSPLEYFSTYMTFTGFASIPAGLGQNSQVVIYFYYDNNGQKGDLVTSINPETRTLKGQALISTTVTPIPQNSNFNSPITLKIRYGDLGVVKGYPQGPIITRLFAEPVLLVDNFPVRIGQLLPFFVAL